jgi:hypothetical protein
VAVRNRIPVDPEAVFPAGIMVLGVEPVNDFDKVRAEAADKQEIDSDSGLRVWLVRGVDLDIANLRKGQAEIGIKMLAAQQPVPPAASGSIQLPIVDFAGLTVTPWVDSSKCTGNASDGRPHRCRARQGFAYWAQTMRPRSRTTRPGVGESSRGSAPADALRGAGSPAA